MAAQALLPEPKQRFDVRLHFQRLGVGIVPFLLSASPFIVGVTAYKIAKLTGSSSLLLWGKDSAFGCLIFFLIGLPVYMLGKALQLSLVSKANAGSVVPDIAIDATERLEINSEAGQTRAASVGARL